MATRRYLCPYCNKRIEKEKLVSHLSRAHSKDLPEGFTAARTAYHIINKRPLDYTRKCRVCGAPTAWDEKKFRYNFLCGKPACEKAWVEKMKVTMGDKMGSNRPTATAEGLQKMLAGRKISGTYKFRDGHEFTYTGSYELETLKFLDQVLEVKSEDLQVPGPVLTYTFQGKEHMYITDMYYIPYNLLIEVKDGGSNPNTNAQYATTRAKQMAKENYVIKKTDYNYLRLTDNDLSQLFTVFAELKLNMVEEENERLIRVHEETQTEERTLDTIIFDFGHVLVYDRDPMVNAKDNIEVCYYTDSLLKTLKEKGYKLYYLSNWDEESFNYYKEKGTFEFMKYFDGGIISYQIEQEKPAVSIYKALIDKYNIDTQRAIFLDDKQENIESARSENLVGIVFDKPFVNILMELPAVKKSEVVSEGAIMNQKDILYNKDKFDSGEINVCFVTGLSGSGKSTLANRMEKEGVEKYELDDVLANYAFTDDNLKEYGEVISGFFKGPGKKYRIQPDEKNKREEWTDQEEAGAVRGFVDYTLNYAKSHKATKFVIEGVELYWFYKPEELKEYAVYIKGTSALISMIRSAKRDSSDVSGLARLSSFLKNVFRKDRAHAYFKTETTIQKWRDFYTGVTDVNIHENMLAASQGFMLMNPNDTVIVNFMKHNTFVHDGDYAIAFNQKLDKLFARDEHGILKEFTTSFLLDTTYTPYIVDDNANFVREFIENHINTKVSSGEIYEAVFDHPLYSNDQIMFEGRATKYKDYYKMLQDTDEYIARATQPGDPEFMVPIGERATIKTKGDVTLYHGSCDGSYEKIRNNSANSGKRWETIRQSSFWFKKKEYAIMFATAELLQKESNSRIYILIDNDMKTLVPEKYKEEAEKIMKTKHSFVYIKTVDNKYVNGGQGRNFPEYTLDFEVKPDEVYSNTYEDMRNSVKYCTDEYLVSIIKKYKDNTMTYGNSLFGIFVDKIMYNTHQDLIKAKRTIKKYNESSDLSSSVDSKHEQKEVLKLSSFTKEPLSEEIINKLKSKSDLNVREDGKGFVWKDGDEIVCFINTKGKEIVDLEVFGKYKSHGLSKQLLDFAVKDLGCDNLYVVKENKLAKKIYEDYGFVVSKEVSENGKLYGYEMVLKKSTNEACKDLATARKFASEVKELAKEYDANFYLVTDGASATNNDGTNDAVKYARDTMKKWETERGFDAKEDWSKVKECAEVFDDISEPWFITSDDGATNCCISVPGYEHCMRGRSSMLCLKHDTGIWEVFLRKSVDDYGAPGGGWNKNESPMDAAIREAREEARLEVTNVKRMGTLIEYHEEVQDWVKQHVKNPKDWWYGYYSAVFVGLYDGKYTGEIADIDKDPIEYQGKWYPVEDSMPGLPKEYYEAIKKYIEEEDRNNG